MHKWVTHRLVVILISVIGTGFFLVILVGIIGAGLGVAAVVIGVRRRVRVVMAAIGLALSILGIISAVAFTEAFVSSLNSIGSSSSSGPAVPAQSVGGTEESAAVTSYTLSITGSAARGACSMRLASTDLPLT